MTPPMTRSDELAEIARGLSASGRRNVLAFRSPGTWLMACEMKDRGAMGMGLTLLVAKHALVERRWCSWGADRGQGLQAGEGYEYRLTPLGLLVRNHLLSEGQNDGRA